MFKKALIVLVLFLMVWFCPGAAGAQDHGGISTNTIFDAVAMIADETVTSKTFNLDKLKPRGYFSVQIYLNDTDANIDLWYEVSNDGTNWARPLDSDGVRVDLLFDDFAEDSGIDSGPRDIKAFGPVVAKYLRFKVQEATIDNAITGFTAAIAWQ